MSKSRLITVTLRRIQETTITETFKDEEEARDYALAVADDEEWAELPAHYEAETTVPKEQRSGR